jgi:hypothetical protein
MKSIFRLSKMSQKSKTPANQGTPGIMDKAKVFV